MFHGYIFHRADITLEVLALPSVTFIYTYTYSSKYKWLWCAYTLWLLSPKWNNLYHIWDYRYTFCPIFICYDIIIKNIHHNYFRRCILSSWGYITHIKCIETWLRSVKQSKQMWSSVKHIMVQEVCHWLRSSIQNSTNSSLVMSPLPEITKVFPSFAFASHLLDLFSFCLCVRARWFHKYFISLSNCPKLQKYIKDFCVYWNVSKHDWDLWNHWIVCCTYWILTRTT